MDFTSKTTVFTATVLASLHNKHLYIAHTTTIVSPPAGAVLLCYGIFWTIDCALVAIALLSLLQHPTIPWQHPPVKTPITPTVIVIAL